MKRIDLQFQTMYADLVQQSLDDEFIRDFSLDGHFSKRSVKGRDYWYYRSAQQNGARMQRYVGPAADPEITRRVEKFLELKSNAKSRRTLVSALTTIGLAAPDRFTGDVVEAMSNAGLFRLRGVLVGTVAFQTYPGLLGVRFPRGVQQTRDADFAQFHSISAAVEDSLPPMIDVLRHVDSTFQEAPAQADGRFTTQFINKDRFKVEFLTPNRGSDDFLGKPAKMPALGGASAIPLRFLDYLIHQPQRAVVLHKQGIGVLVPAPERFAVHKLIISSRRTGEDQIKRTKDVAQAETLMTTMHELRMSEDLALAFDEAIARGPAWRDALAGGLRRSSDEVNDLVRSFGVGLGLT